MKLIQLLCALCILMILMVACSHADFPLTPSSDESINILPGSSGTSTAVTHGRNTSVFGAWEVRIDVKNLTAEVIPARNAVAIGHTFDADLLQFLTKSPCSNCLRITGLDFVLPEQLHMDVTMKHPFSNLAARPDLHGFDVRAIFIGADYNTDDYSPIKVMGIDGVEKSAELNYYTVLNADGYTSHYDEIVNDPRYFMGVEDQVGNLNPFLRYFENYSTAPFDPQNPSGHNVMAVGSSEDTRTAVISLYSTMDRISLFIVADVAYGQSATLANRTNPLYYLPQFNRTEPCRMEYWIENNTLSQNDPASTADIIVQVVDWQHNATVDPNYPDPANLSGVRESSKVSKVELYVPNLQPDVIEATIPEAGDGSPANPLKYRLTVTNVNQTNYDVFRGLIAIRDELHGAAAPSGRMPIPESPSGFPYDTLDIRDYSLYNIIYINQNYVDWSHNAYNNELVVDYKSCYGNPSVSVKATHFMDPGRLKFQYLWDYDYDGVTFNEDGSGIPSPYVDLSPGGRRMFGLKVVTSSYPPREYIYKIPVYTRGVDFENTIPAGYQPKFILSNRRNHAVAMTQDKYYLAYISNNSGTWQVWLGVVEPDSGNATLYQVTQDSDGPCYDPAIVVDEENSRLYIAYSCLTGMIIKILSNYTDLDNIYFDPANVGVVCNPGSPNSATQPCLLFHDNTVLCYFTYRSWVPSSFKRIYATRSTDNGQTWIDLQPVDDSSNNQSNPSATFVSLRGDTYVAYEDYRDEVLYGSDLYMAVESDGDGVDFNYKMNLSQDRDLVNDLSPSISSSYDTIAIAYLKQEPGNVGNDICAMILPGGGHLGIYTTISSGQLYDYRHSPPSMVLVTENTLVIGYTGYSSTSQLLKSYLVTYKNDGFGHLYPQMNEYRDIGTIDIAAADDPVAVGGYSGAGDNVTVSFGAFTDYSHGIILDDDPFGKYFGCIKMMSTVIEGFDF